MRVQLFITHVDGRTEVKGPVGDKLLCYGLLEEAKDAIRRFCEQQQASPIVLAQPGVKLERNGE